MFFPLTFLPADTFLVNMLSFRHAVTGPRTLVGCKAGYFIYFMLTSHFTPAASLHHGNPGPPFDWTSITAGAGAASGKTVSPVDSTEIIGWSNINIGSDRLKQINSGNKARNNIRQSNIEQF